MRCTLHVILDRNGRKRNGHGLLRRRIRLVASGTDQLLPGRFDGRPQSFVDLLLLDGRNPTPPKPLQHLEDGRLPARITIAPKVVMPPHDPTAQSFLLGSPQTDEPRFLHRLEHVPAGRIEVPGRTMMHRGRMRPGRILPQRLDHGMTDRHIGHDDVVRMHLVIGAHLLDCIYLCRLVKPGQRRLEPVLYPLLLFGIQDLINGDVAEVDMARHCAAKEPKLTELQVRPPASALLRTSRIPAVTDPLVTPLRLDFLLKPVTFFAILI